MASRSWLLVVGSCCLILAAVENGATTTTTTTTTAAPSATTTGSQGTTQKPVATGEELTNQSLTTQTAPSTSSSTTPTTAATQTTTLKSTSNGSAAGAGLVTTTTAAASPKGSSTTNPTTTQATTITKVPPTASPTTPTSNAQATTTTTQATTTPFKNSTDMDAPTSGPTMSSDATNAADVTTGSSASTNTSTVSVPEGTTPTPTVSTGSQSSTTVQSTTTASTTTVSHTTSTVLPNLLINEFSYNDLFSNGSTFDVEIRCVDGKAAPTMVVLVSDLKMECIAVVQIGSAAWKGNLAYTKANLTPANRRSVIVALYTSVNWANCSDVTAADVAPVDATIVSQYPVTTVTTKIPFVSDYLSRILIAAVNESSTEQASVSVVRCEDTHLDPGSFIIASSTFNQSNNCDLDPAPTLKKITLNYTACNTWNKTTTRKLINYFVEKVGEKFRCGFSPVYVQNAAINCTKSTTIQWYIAGKFEAQYDNVVNDTTCMDSVTPGELCLVTACHNCIIAKKTSPKNGDISVTVGVVIACIVIFLVIVAIVILYIRKKRRGILQFRMTRLDDDDDDLIMTNDTDDFVGGGQEASFSNSSYTRFK